MLRDCGNSSRKTSLKISFKTLITTTLQRIANTEAKKPSNPHTRIEEEE